MDKITIGGGKYTIVNELSNGGGLRALRHGEEWRDLTGDGMVLAMYHEIEQLQEKVEYLERLNRRRPTRIPTYSGPDFGFFGP